MAPAAPRFVLLLGDRHAPEFAAVVSRLRGSVRHRRLLEFSSPTQLFRQFPEPPAVELAVVCQSWPDQFPRREILQLLEWLPMTRLICCQGAWCEADGRTRDLWPLATRLPLDETLLELERLLPRLPPELGAGGAPDSAAPVSSPESAAPHAGSAHAGSDPGSCDPPFSKLPLTASRAEIFAHRVRPCPDRSPPPAARGGLPPSAAPPHGLVNPAWVSTATRRRVLVDSPDPAWRLQLQAWVRGCGWSPVDPGADTWDLLLFDVDPWCPPRQERLAELVRQAPRARVIAMTGMPWQSLETAHWPASRVRRWSKTAPLTLLARLCQELDPPLASEPR